MKYRVCVAWTDFYLIQQMKLLSLRYQQKLRCEDEMYVTITLLNEKRPSERR